MRCRRQGAGWLLGGWYRRAGNLQQDLCCINPPRKVYYPKPRHEIQTYSPRYVVQHIGARFSLKTHPITRLNNDKIENRYYYGRKSKDLIPEKRKGKGRQMKGKKNPSFLILKLSTWWDGMGSRGEELLGSELVVITVTPPRKRRQLYPFSLSHNISFYQGVHHR